MQKASQRINLNSPYKLLSGSASCIDYFFEGRVVEQAPNSKDCDESINYAKFDLINMTNLCYKVKILW